MRNLWVKIKNSFVKLVSGGANWSKLSSVVDFLKNYLYFLPVIYPTTQICPPSPSNGILFPSCAIRWP